MAFLPYYFMVGAIIFLVYGIKSQKWGTALLLALLWPLGALYLLVSLIWGIGSLLD